MPSNPKLKISHSERIKRGLYLKDKTIKRMLYEFETENKEMKQALDNLEKCIIKYYGKECKKRAVRCGTCQIWANFHALKLNFY